MDINDYSSDLLNNQTTMESNSTPVEYFNPKHAWSLIRAFMNDTANGVSPLLRHQITSYDKFLKEGIDNVIQGCSPIVQEIYEDNGCKIRIEMSFDNIRLKKPIITEKNGFTRPMYPNEARLRNDTYAAKTETTIHNKVIVSFPGCEPTIHESIVPRVSIGSIPIMIGSCACSLMDMTPKERREKGECTYDDGGYFIINGGERVIMSQEMITENQLFIFQGGRGSRYLYLGELKSAPEEKEGFVRGYCIKLMKTKDKGNVLRVNIPKIRMDIPLVTLFRAIGIYTDEQIVRMVIGDIKHENASVYWKLFKPSMVEAENIHTELQALESLAGNTSLTSKVPLADRIEFVRKILRDDFLPHLGTNPTKKGWFMGYSAMRILRCSIDLEGYDDRDSYTNKRAELSGTLMTRLFYQYWSSKMVRDIRSAVQKELTSGAWRATRNYKDVVNATNIFKIIRTTTIDAGLKYSLATGNFGMKNTIGKVGVSQVLTRLNRNSMMSHLRRLSTPLEKSGKLVAPRKLHPTCWGIVCPSETPEGESVGVVKNLSVMCIITNGSSSLPVRSWLNSRVILTEDLDALNSAIITTYTRVWVNGDLFGYSSNGLKLLKEAKRNRSSGVFHPMTTVYMNGRDLYIHTDSGRILRPLLKIGEDGNIVMPEEAFDILKHGEMDWTTLVRDPKGMRKEAWIEYMDMNEMNSAMVLMGPRYKKDGIGYTHMEIHPATCLGTMASLIPFPDHNQAPRNTYQSAMGKQAMGVYATNYLDRMDTAGSVLCYPQKPLVYNHMDKYFKNTSLPNGLNAVVAIMCFTGYNQEDSVLLNKDAIDRGLFRSFFYRTYRDEEKKNASTGEEEKFCRPDRMRTEAMRHGSYEKLNDEGFVPVNTWVSGNDIIMGKVSPLRDSASESSNKKKGARGGAGVEPDIMYRDLSKTLKPNESGYIDHVYRNINGDGYYVMKIRVRSERTPTIGDKFSSRHGQKGTCGMVVPSQDMPFTADGIRPDIIINPHAIPSRMTIAQIVECVLGKAGCLAGSFGNGTPFEPFDIQKIGDALEQQGMERWGNETLMSGITGEVLPCKIFIGPTFYQRLKHMVEDKIHSRSSGPVVMLTRQPAEGRSRDGGHRFGEMERDCMISHGTAVFLKERMLDVSDKFPLTLSKASGRVAVSEPRGGTYRDLGDDSSKKFSHIYLPAAMKLLMQEIESIGIVSKMITS
jgi:DNA-directed RNA polymerase II subunit RPB2